LPDFFAGLAAFFAGLTAFFPYLLVFLVLLAMAVFQKLAVLFSSHALTNSNALPLWLILFFSSKGISANV
jgi:hypothetical protein